MDVPPPTSSQQFELAPPMAPPNSSTGSGHPHRPQSLFSTGLASISANYADEGDSGGSMGEHTAQHSFLAPLVSAALGVPSSPYAAPSSSFACAPSPYCPSPYATTPAQFLSPLTSSHYCFDPFGVFWPFAAAAANDMISYSSELSHCSSLSTSASSSIAIPLHSPLSHPSLQLPSVSPSLPPSSVDFFAHHPPPQFFVPSEKSVLVTKGQTIQQGLAMPRRSAAASSSSGVGTAKTKRGGGRRPRESEEQLSDEDKDRRAKRRERNKLAAARCRQRREEKMNSLQQQVNALKEENARRERQVQELRESEARLLELLGMGSGEQQPSLVLGISRPCALIQPFPVSSGRKRALPEFKEEQEETTDESTEGESPTSSTDGATIGFFSSRGRNMMLVKGADPVISESALVNSCAQQTAKKARQDHEGSSPRPTSLPLGTNSNGCRQLLYDKGYVASTPSKELSFGNGSGLTPGSELITPGLSQLGQLAESGAAFGVLMAQQTGLTPCQHGPVLIQQGADRPPNGELSELR